MGGGANHFCTNRGIEFHVPLIPMINHLIFGTLSSLNSKTKAAFRVDVKDLPTLGMLGPTDTEYGAGTEWAEPSRQPRRIIIAPE